MATISEFHKEKDEREEREVGNWREEYGPHIQEEETSEYWAKVSWFTLLTNGDSWEIEECLSMLTNTCKVEIIVDPIPHTSIEEEIHRIDD